VNVDDGPVVAASKVTDVGAQQFISAQAGKQCGEDEGAVAFDPVAASPRFRVCLEGPQASYLLRAFGPRKLVRSLLLGENTDI
jgi:hypothetical protein